MNRKRNLVQCELFFAKSIFKAMSTWIESYTLSTESQHKSGGFLHEPLLPSPGTCPKAYSDNENGFESQAFLISFSSTVVGRHFPKVIYSICGQRRLHKLLSLLQDSLSLIFRAHDHYPYAIPKNNPGSARSKILSNSLKLFAQPLPIFYHVLSLHFSCFALNHRKKALPAYSMFSGQLALGWIWSMRHRCGIGGWGLERRNQAISLSFPSPFGWHLLGLYFFGGSSSHQTGLPWFKFLLETLLPSIIPPD